MALEKITDDGHISWRCHRGAVHHPDSELITAHISHEDLQYTPEGVVALPPCPVCKEAGIWSRCFVTVSFTPKERFHVGMQEEPGTTTQMLPHAETGQMVPVTITTMVPRAENPYPARHEELARQLQNMGKTVPEPLEVAITPTPVDPTTLQKFIEDLITGQLQEHGVITSPKLPAIDPIQQP